MSRSFEAYLLAALVTVAAVAFAVHPSTTAAAPGDPDAFSNRGRVVNPQDEMRVDPGAATSSLEAEFCPTNVASTPLPASAILAGAKSLYVENRSSATCYASFDAAAATSTGNRGFKWAPGTERSMDVSGTTFGSRIRVACTAALTTNACLWLQWFE